MPVFIQGRESVKVPDGMHQGTITKVEKDTRPHDAPKYEYIDIYIDLADVRNSQDNAVQLKDSAPANLTPNTKLGQLLMRFGITQNQIASGQQIDIEQVLLGKQVTLQTLEETSERGTFAKVVAGSLKPVAPAPTAGAQPAPASSLIDNTLDKFRVKENEAYQTH